MEVVKISEQLWTRENLSVSRYRNGNPIPEVRSPKTWMNLKTGAWCHYKNESNLGSQYGKLYNWYAVTDPRGLAPNGFKIPTSYDWRVLLRNLYSNRGRDLPHLSIENESTAEVDELSYLFTDNPMGYRNSSGYYNDQDIAVGWWTFPDSRFTNPYHDPNAYFICAGETTIHWKPCFQTNMGFYVRCLKEENKTITLYFEDDFKLSETMITLKYTENMTFQELLNLLYNRYLAKKVPPHSYGHTWEIVKYDSWQYRGIQKYYNDTKTIDSVLFTDERSVLNPIFIVMRI